MMKMLPDINIWLALTFEQHKHHSIAKAWFDKVGDADDCAFCRMTQQGLLRLATNRQAVQEDVLTMREAWGAYDALMADPHVSFAMEPPTTEQRWREFTNRDSLSTDAWSDAWLAAVAMCTNRELITLDKGFQYYRPGGLRVKILAT